MKLLLATLFLAASAGAVTVGPPKGTTAARPRQVSRGGRKVARRRRRAQGEGGTGGSESGTSSESGMGGESGTSSESGMGGESGMSGESGSMSESMDTGEGGGEGEGSTMGSEGEGGSGGLGLGGCFAGSTTVHVQGQGPVPMHQLEVGDRIQVDVDQYEPVYGFYKHDATSMRTFVQIETGDDGPSLELTESLLLFADSDVAKRAVEIQVGDVLSGGHTVSKISTSNQKGIYSPLTNSGKLVVNEGIVASTYGTVMENSSSMEIAGFEMGINLHSWFHFVQTYHRLTCTISWDSCRNETYDEHGYSRMFFMIPFYKWWMSQNWLVGSMVLIPTVAGLTVLRVLEVALQNIMAFVATATALAVAASMQRKTSAKKVV